MKYCATCQKTYPNESTVCSVDQSPLQLATELQPGMILLNKYQILDQIGIGGMGRVYRGKHLTFNEFCAIKIVNEDIAGNANFLKRFQTEAIVTRKLRHPNAVRVDDFDYTADGRPFIVMELVEGKNISQVLQQEGSLAVPRAVRIAQQVAMAIGMAHKLGIIHRDIKPGNIILATDENGQETAKVLDFGIAKLREAAGTGQSEMTMTMTGMVVGTPLYMSPEQFMGKKSGEDIDGRTDIYSLGVVLYQMVTAQLPFEADTPYALMLAHLQTTVRPPHELKPELQIPGVLSRVILKAMEKAREQRFQTAEEFAEALGQIGSFQPADIPITTAPPYIAVSPVTSSVSQASAFPPTNADRIPAPVSSAVFTPVVTPTSAPVSKVATTPTSSAQIPVVPNPATGIPVGLSAEQHAVVPTRSPLKLFLRGAVVVLAGALVLGAGYLKYRSMQRVRIENSVGEKLKTAPSPTLIQSATQGDVRHPCPTPVR